MAHRMLKWSSLLFYLFPFVLFFFIGCSVAGMSGVADNQGLAAGAIVIGYGILAGVFSLVPALFVASKTNSKQLIRINFIFAFSIICLVIIFQYRSTNQKNKSPEKIEKSTTQMPPSLFINSLSTVLPEMNPAKEKMGLGMFTPDMFNNDVFYFYGNLNLQKSILEHSATDSITFQRSEFGGVEIATAPPWLVPDHLKLDYDLLYFKVISVTDDFVELLVNTQTNQTAFANKRAGNIHYWPDFLLSVHSVELINPEMNFIHIKPLKHSAQISQEYTFLSPIRIRNDWMEVELLNDDLKVIENGWIQWKTENELAITYSLLS